MKTIALVAVVAASMLVLPGCKDFELAWWNWFDPSKPLRAPEQMTINPIFPGIGMADQTDEILPNAEMPKPEDLDYAEEDYVIGPTDVLTISIMDLYQQGLETLLQRQVAHGGNIDLPQLGARRVKVSGLTQSEAIEVIRKAYIASGILMDPTVAVTVAVPRGDTFSILGAIARPGTYNILRRDFTLLEALALAGDVTQSNIDYLYIIRTKEKRKPVASAPRPTTRPEDLPDLPTLPVEPIDTTPTTAPAPTTQPGGEPPSIEDQLRDLDKMITGPSTPVSLSAMSMGPTVGSSAPKGGEVPADLKAAAPATKWIYVNGNWVEVPVGATAPATPPKVVPTTPIVPTPPTTLTVPTTPVAPITPSAEPVKDPSDPFGWAKYDMSDLKRLIAIDLNKLKDGNPRMNIVIRDSDIVHIPNLRVGEFYVMGEVSRPGAYALTGRRVTVKQAVAAAGNLGGLAWPNNSVLIRRIGRDQEQTMPLRLQDIMSGNEPDMFLKANDTIAVGSYWAAPFLAVWRNAFRMTYGFGFIYDRNYSVSDFEIPVFFPSKGPR